MQSGFKGWLQGEPAQQLFKAKATAKQPLVCLDLIGDLAMSLMRLSLLITQWRQVPASTALHWVWVGDAREVPRQAPVGLSINPKHWPPPMPGMHRCWFESAGRPVSLTLALGNPDQLVGELVLNADWIMIDGQPLTPAHITVPSATPHPALSLLSDRQSQMLSVTDRLVEPVKVPDPVNPVNQSQTSLFAWREVQAQAQASGSVLFTTASQRRAVVIGAGISGLTMAAVLAGRGWAVQVLDPRPPGANSRHAQHLAAALTPVVSSDDNERSQLARAGALAADRFWSSLPTVIGRRCGALQLQRPQTQRRFVDLQATSDAFAMPTWAHWVDAAQASDFAQMALPRGGLWMPGGWLVQVARLLEVLAQMPGVTVFAGKAQTLQRQAGEWLVTDEQSQVLAQAPVVVVANAGDASALMRRSNLWPDDEQGSRARLAGLHQLAGEITCLPAQALDAGPACIVGGDGYVLPAVNGWCVSGGTYVREATQAQCTEQGRQANRQRAAELLNMPSLAGDLQGVALPGWAGFRAVLPGRLPAIGPLTGQGCEGLWMQTAGASRGLTWSVLGAELVADALEGVPLALQQSLLKRLLPGI